MMTGGDMGIQKIKADDPAMPVVETNNYDGHLLNEMHYPGLTILQFLAAKNMAALIAKWADFYPNGNVMNVRLENCAKLSVAGANALIAELNK